MQQWEYKTLSYYSDSVKDEWRDEGQLPYVEYVFKRLKP